MGIISVIKKNWPVLIIVALWVIFSAPYFLKGLIPFPSDYLVSFFPPWNASYAMPVKNNAMPDVITQIYPWKKFTIESWKQGIIPLWNPYSFSGTVHAGNYQSAVFSPITILFFLFSFVDAWSIMVLLQPLLAGLFMYLLMRRALALSTIGSLIGSLGFMFCGFMTTWMAYGTLGYAILPLPLILFAIEKYMHKPMWWQGIIIALGMFFSFVSGHFQISIYCFLFSVGYVAYNALVYKKYKRAFILIVYLGLGVLLAAPQLLLTFDAFQNSSRASNTVAKEVIPWQYIITLLSPDFYGNPVTRNDWFGHYAEWAVYIGIVPLLLSLFGVIFSKEKKRIFFVISGLTALLLAYATPLSFLLFFLKVPVLSTSAASRIIILVSFSLLVLSGFGFDHLMFVWKKGNWKKVAVFVSAIGILLLGVWTSLVVFHWFTVEQFAIAKRNLFLPTCFMLISLLCMSVGFLKKKYIVAGISIVFILLTAFDMYRYASKWIPYGQRTYMYPETKTLSFLTKTNAYDRFFGNLGGEVGNYYHIGLVDGYDAMYQGRYGEFINTFSRGIVSPAPRSVVTIDKYGQYTPLAIQLLGIRYIVHRISDGRNVWAFPFWQYSQDEMHQIYRDEHHEVYEYTKAYPRAFLASSYVLKTDPQEIIDTLFTINTRDTVVLETDPGIQPASGSGIVKIDSYKPGTTQLHVETSVPTLLFISDVYDKGWQATIDGKKTDIYRADYDFIAVSVPMGTHEIQLQYAPKSFQWGLYIAFTSFGILCLLVLLRKKL